MSATSTVSSKGQIVIPARLRKRFGFKEGTTVVFHEEQGRLVLERRDYDAIFALEGTLAAFPLEQDLAEERQAARNKESNR